MCRCSYWSETGTVTRTYYRRVRSTTGRLCFHRCLSVHRRGGGTLVSDTWSFPGRSTPGLWYLAISLGGGGVTQSGMYLGKVYPSQACSHRGTPRTEGYLSTGQGVTHQERTRYQRPGVLPDRKGVTTPPPTGQATLPAVRLLRSRRRTFLLFPIVLISASYSRSPLIFQRLLDCLCMMQKLTLEVCGTSSCTEKGVRVG